jgi:uncharacterized metal-binding protein
VPVDEVIANTDKLRVLSLLQRDKKVALLSRWGLCAFTLEPKDRAVTHTWLNHDFFLGFDREVFRLAIGADQTAIVTHCFLAAVKELLKCAMAFNMQVSRMSLSALSYRVFVDVGFDLLNQLNLLVVGVQSDGERVIRAKKDLKHLQRVTTELVALNAFRTGVPVFKSGLSVLIVYLAQLR